MKWGWRGALCFTVGQKEEEEEAIETETQGLGKRG